MPLDFKEGILNFYKHDDCKAHWVDLWSCGCDDRCPTCGAEIEPYSSLDVRDIEKRFTTKRKVRHRN